MCVFFNDTATTEIYTLSLHDALPISERAHRGSPRSLSSTNNRVRGLRSSSRPRTCPSWCCAKHRSSRPCCPPRDRKSTRLNSSHANISYAVFCLKKKNYKYTHTFYIR